MAARQKIVTIITEYLLMKGNAVSHALPRKAPAKTRTVFHTALPMAVSSKNSGIFISLMPAGMDIRLRISGIQRHIRTALF